LTGTRFISQCFTYRDLEIISSRMVLFRRDIDMLQEWLHVNDRRQQNLCSVPGSAAQSEIVVDCTVELFYYSNLLFTTGAFAVSKAN
jgi:hypothetical protein